MGKMRFGGDGQVIGGDGGGGGGDAAYANPGSGSKIAPPDPVSHSDAIQVANQALSASGVAKAVNPFHSVCEAGAILKDVNVGVGLSLKAATTPVDITARAAGIAGSRGGGSAGG